MAWRTAGGWGGDILERGRERRIEDDELMKRFQRNTQDVFFDPYGYGMRQTPGLAETLAPGGSESLISALRQQFQGESGRRTRRALTGLQASGDVLPGGYGTAALLANLGAESDLSRAMASARAGSAEANLGRLYNFGQEALGYTRQQARDLAQFERQKELTKMAGKNRGRGGLGLSVGYGPVSVGFARGGYVDRPTLALLGEEEPEYVIPAERYGRTQYQMPNYQLPYPDQDEEPGMAASVDLKELIRVLRGQKQPRAMKDGGLVRKPTVALIGEDGPEWVIPRSRLTDGRPMGGGVNDFSGRSITGRRSLAGGSSTSGMGDVYLGRRGPMTDGQQSAGGINDFSGGRIRSMGSPSWSAGDAEYAGDRGPLTDGRPMSGGINDFGRSMASERAGAGYLGRPPGPESDGDPHTSPLPDPPEPFHMPDPVRPRGFLETIGELSKNLRIEVGPNAPGWAKFGALTAGGLASAGRQRYERRAQERQSAADYVKQLNQRQAQRYARELDITGRKPTQMIQLGDGTWVPSTSAVGSKELVRRNPELGPKPKPAPAPKPTVNVEATKYVDDLVRRIDRVRYSNELDAILSEDTSVTMSQDQKARVQAAVRAARGRVQ